MLGGGGGGGGGREREWGSVGKNQYIQKHH